MPAKFIVKLTFCLALASALSARVVSQQAAPDATAQSQQRDEAKTPETASQPDKAEESKDPGKIINQGKIAGTSNDRLFYTLPNFLTLESAGSVPPLSTKQKFAVVARSAFDPVVIPWYAAISAGSQAQNRAGIWTRLGSLREALCGGLLRWNHREFYGGRGAAVGAG